MIRSDDALICEVCGTEFSARAGAGCPNDGDAAHVEVREQYAREAAGDAFIATENALTALARYAAVNPKLGALITPYFASAEEALAAAGERDLAIQRSALEKVAACISVALDELPTGSLARTAAEQMFKHARVVIDLALEQLAELKAA